MKTSIQSGRGMALLLTILVMLLVSAVALGLALTSTIDTMIAGHYRGAVEALLAADAGLERAAADLARTTDWDGVLQGHTRSGFVDGTAGGTRLGPGGSVIDLTLLTNQANCGHAAPCSTSEIERVSAERPWGANNPRWQLYAYGPANLLTPAGAPPSLFYVVVWVADDPSETDDDPLRDGGAGPGVGGGSGAGVLSLRSEAFGPSGAHRAIEAVVVRDRMPATDPEPGSAPAGRVRIVSWRERY